MLTRLKTKKNNIDLDFYLNSEIIKKFESEILKKDQIIKEMHQYTLSLELSIINSGKNEEIMLLKDKLDKNLQYSKELEDHITNLKQDVKNTTIEETIEEKKETLLEVLSTPVKKEKSPIIKNIFEQDGENQKIIFKFQEFLSKRNTPLDILLNNEKSDI